MSKNGLKKPTKSLSKGTTNPKGKKTALSEPEYVDFRMTKTTLWVAIVLILFCGFLYVFSPILMPFLISLIFAYALHPLTTRLQKIGLSRTVATSLMVIAVLGLIVTIVLVAFPFLRDELRKLSSSLPATIAYLSEQYLPTIKTFVSQFSSEFSGQLETKLTDHASKILNWVLKALASLFTNTLAFANVVSLILLSPLLIFYLLRDWPKMISYLETLVPPHMKHSTTSVFSDMNTTLSGFFRGQALVCFLMGIYYTIGLKLLGVNYAFTIGIVSGVLTFIPYVGFFSGLVAAVGVALAQFEGFKEVLLVILVYGIGNILEGFVLVPKCVGDKLGLHPLWVIFALLGGGLIFGFLGLLLAVPLAGILAVVLRFVMTKYRAQIMSQKNRKS